ncbi:S1C family serine protease [Lachnobacterium bovis]|uniref:S1C family serine protease n=1 Tax=Lachnobacterium bovis TaxID=140626 RepID=UPI000685D5C7|nr:trypsin-like peptidase domain-containing protein [Lachnobacterium bovis]
MNESNEKIINDTSKKKGDGKFLRGVLITLTCGAIAGGTFAGSFYLYNTKLKTFIEQQEDSGLQTATSTSSKKTLIKNNDVSGVVKNTMPSIVAITNTSEKKVSSFFSSEDRYQTQKSVGSGIIVKEDGDKLYIVTNNHVIDGSTKLTVKFCDNETAEASIRGNVAKNDLAVITVKLSSLPKRTKNKIKVATFGKSSEIKVGESAIAIGNALGYGQSVTTGIISAVDREVTTSDTNNTQKYTNKLIQTDAAINPGNSGGALLNAKGELIGINSAKYSSSAVEGMGFAIPIDTAATLINDMIKNGTRDNSYKDSEPSYKRRYRSYDDDNGYGNSGDDDSDDDSGDEFDGSDDGNDYDGSEYGY